jgi:hypothetical protein
VGFGQGFHPLLRDVVRIMGIFRTALPLAGRAVRARASKLTPGGAWTGPPSRARRDMGRNYGAAKFRALTNS